MNWIVRKLENGQFESAYWQRPADTAREAVELAVANGHLGAGLYLAMPDPISNGTVYEPMPLYRVTVSEPRVSAATFRDDQYSKGGAA